MIPTDSIKYLQEHLGCMFSIAVDGKHKRKWRNGNVLTEDDLRNYSINCCQELPNEITLESDYKDAELYKNLENQEHAEAILQKANAGYYISSHKGKSNYLRFRFKTLQEITPQLRLAIIRYLAKPELHFDENFFSLKYVRPVPNRPHWKHSYEIEKVIKVVEGQDLDIDSLGIKALDKFIRSIRSESLPYTEMEIDTNDFLIVNRFGAKSVNEDKFAKYLIDKYNFKTIYGKTFDELLMFDGRVYSPEKAKEVIKTECENILQEYCKNKNVLEIIEKIKRSTPISKDAFDNVPLNYIPLENGIYDINKKKLLTHNPDLPFRYYLPIEYNSESKCPEFLNFLNETLLPEDLPVIQEWFGFCLYRVYFIKKGLIFVGLKDTGKTILLKTLVRFIGEKNTCGLSLQRITSENTFALSSLYAKHLNAYDDLSSKDLTNGGGFKIVTGGGYITAEEKFGDNFSFLNYAKQVFACNKIPPIRDDDGAYIERWMPIEFLNQVPEKDIDPFLFEKLTSSEQLSGILNWALEGLQRLITNKRFSYLKNKDQVKHLMERSGDFLIKFADDCLTQSEDQFITKEQMFELYTFWANKTDSPRISKEQLGRRLENSVKYLISKQGAKERFWDNVKINFNSDFSKLNKLDTLDTFKKNMRENRDEIINSLDINSEKVSKVSAHYDSDRLDTIYKKDIEIIVSPSQPFTFEEDAQ